MGQYDKRPDLWGARGEKNPRAVLNTETVKVIKQRIRDGATLVQLSQEFNVSLGTLSNIKNGRTWGHVK